MVVNGAVLCQRALAQKGSSYCTDVLQLQRLRLVLLLSLLGSWPTLCRLLLLLFSEPLLLPPSLQLTAFPPSRHTRASSCSSSCSNRPAVPCSLFNLPFLPPLHDRSLAPHPYTPMMTDDSRANAPRGPRKANRRILLVSNPTQSSSDEDKPDTYYPPQPPHSGPSQSYTHEHSLPPNNRVQPPPLSTKDLPEHRNYYPSSRSNPSNPALSSPSSTSSHVLESTPPPSTPGQSQPSVDIVSEGTLRPEHATLIAHERSDSLPSHPSRASPNDRPKPQTSHSSPNPNHIHQISSRPATVSPFPLLYLLPIDMPRSSRPPFPHLTLSVPRVLVNSEAFRSLQSTFLSPLTQIT